MTRLEELIRELIALVDDDENQIRLYEAGRPYVEIKKLLGIPE